MPQTAGMQHLHKRKRISQKLKPFPHKDPRIRFLDNFLLVIAVIGPIMVLPQIFQIYIYKNPVGVSMLTWSLLAMINIPWIIYGIVHKDKPIIIAQTLWFIANITVVTGAIMYA